MINKLKAFKYTPYIIGICFCYYVLPLFMISPISLIGVFVIIIPIFLVIISYLLAKQMKKVSVVYIACVMFAFIPSVFIFMNSTALPYVFFYGGCALLGSCIGYTSSRRVI